jgi:hypothetical protein
MKFLKRLRTRAPRLFLPACRIEAALDRKNRLNDPLTAAAKFKTARERLG